jgi:hypothetical protein
MLWISPSLVCRDDIQRPCDVPHEGVPTVLLWADPTPDISVSLFVCGVCRFSLSIDTHESRRSMFRGFYVFLMLYFCRGTIRWFAYPNRGGAKAIVEYHVSLERMRSTNFFRNMIWIWLSEAIKSSRMDTHSLETASWSPSLRHRTMVVNSTIQVAWWSVTRTSHCPFKCFECKNECAAVQPMGRWSSTIHISIYNR